MHDSNKLSSPSEDENVARLLKLVGRRPPMAESTKNAWTQAFASELAQTIARRRQRRVIWGAALTVAASVSTLFIHWEQINNHFSSTPPAMAYISKSIGEVRISDTLGRQIAPRRETPIAPNTRLRTDHNSYLALQIKGLSLRLNENTEVQLLSSGVRLLQGHVYVDSAVNTSSADAPFSISTPLGQVSDIGTQFTVRYDAQGLWAAVREGSILVRVSETDYRADARSDAAQQVAVARDLNIHISTTQKRGDVWDWSAGLAGAFELEGKSAYAFLQWVSRETGLDLAFDSQKAEDNARNTLLHGDISSFDPEQAVSVVLATTRLVATRIDNRILLISLAE